MKNVYICVALVYFGLLAGALYAAMLAPNWIDPPACYLCVIPLFVLTFSALFFGSGEPPLEAMIPAIIVSVACMLAQSAHYDALQAAQKAAESNAADAITTD